MLPVAVPGFEQSITFDLEDIKTYKNPPFSALARNDISVTVATSPAFVAEFEKMLIKKRWIQGDPEAAVSHASHVVSTKVRVDVKVSSAES